MRQYHIQLDEGDVGGYVLLPGDPGRCEKIARHLEQPRHVRTNREFTTWTGTLDGVAVSVCSTGIGGPSAAIALEELCNIGVHTVIRVGSSGAIDPSLRMGDLVICQAAIRDEGTSHQYAPAIFPAVADFHVLTALKAAAVAGGWRHHLGVVACHDSLYSEIEWQRMPVSERLHDAWEAARRFGTLAAEMESSTLFVIAQIRHIRAGAVLAVVNTAGNDAEMPSDITALPLEPTIATAIGAVRRLIALEATTPV